MGQKRGVSKIVNCSKFCVARDKKQSKHAKAGLEDGARVEKKYRTFGGSIRHWGAEGEEAAWKELRSIVGLVVRIKEQV